MGGAVSWGMARKRAPVFAQAAAPAGSAPPSRQARRPAAKRAPVPRRRVPAGSGALWRERAEEWARSPLAQASRRCSGVRCWARLRATTVACGNVASGACGAFSSARRAARPGSPRPPRPRGVTRPRPRPRLCTSRSYCPCTLGARGSARGGTCEARVPLHGDCVASASSPCSELTKLWRCACADHAQRRATVTRTMQRRERTRPWARSVPQRTLYGHRGG